MGRFAAAIKVILTAGMAFLATVGCSPDAARDPVGMRSDAEPLTQRFPVIGAPELVSWVTWNSASRGVPGPTTYWIDAVITLTPQTAASLVDEFAPTAQGRTPSVQDSLQPEVPPGPFLSSSALDEALSTSGWSSAAYLDGKRNQLVLSAIDD